MATRTPEREVRIRWRGIQSAILLDPTRELDVEGALRASKTTVCLWKELNAALEQPGIHSLIARWTDDATEKILKPIWRSICQQAGVRLTWNSSEGYDELSNKSRVYVLGLKTQDQTNRYAKFRGLTLARVYVDQAEELPQDIYLELAARLSQSGYAHQIVISPNSVNEDHWIASEFPADNRNPHRKYYSLSVYDNRQNLPASVIPNLERLYPCDHPKHRTMVLGKRGMNVIGEPVYKGAFVRAVHEGSAEYDPRLELQMALDFGKHHPYALFRQVSPLGQLRYLGGIFGQDLYLDAFLDLVLEYRARWFPRPVAIRECCDPAGTADTSHGTEGASKILSAKGIHPVTQANANSPAIRLAAIERIAGHLRGRTADRAEKVCISDSDRWIRVSAHEVVIDRVFADGCEAGYVWSPHYISVGSKQVRVPKKDGWYEHCQNTNEYFEICFGAQPVTDPTVELEAYRLPPLAVRDGFMGM